MPDCNTQVDRKIVGRFRKAKAAAETETTNGAQPLAEVQMSNEATIPLDTLSNVAESDQGSNAADLLLQEIHGYPHQDRNWRELAEFTDKLLGVRQTIVPRLALRIFSRDSRWSQEEWREWIAKCTSDRDTMNEAIDIWRDELFLENMNESTRQKEEQATNHGQRRDIRRRAFRAWQNRHMEKLHWPKYCSSFP